AIVEVGGVPETAEVLGVAQATVKTHLHRVFGKTGTARQAELVKLVAAFSSPLVARPMQPARAGIRSENARSSSSVIRALPDVDGAQASQQKRRGAQYASSVTIARLRSPACRLRRRHATRRWNTR